MNFVDSIITKNRNVMITPSDIDARLSPMLFTVPGAANGIAQVKSAAVTMTKNKNILRNVMTVITEIVGYIIAMHPTQ